MILCVHLLLIIHGSCISDSGPEISWKRSKVGKTGTPGVTAYSLGVGVNTYMLWGSEPHFPVYICDSQAIYIFSHAVCFKFLFSTHLLSLSERSRGRWKHFSVGSPVMWVEVDGPELFRSFTHHRRKLGPLTAHSLGWGAVTLGRRHPGACSSFLLPSLVGVPPTSQVTPCST